MNSPARKYPLILIHGFAQTPRSWQTVIDLLPEGIEVQAIELPGHGQTALSAGEPSIEAVRGHILNQLEGSATRKSILWGYSQGARVALDVAISAPDRVAALILESGSAGIDDPQARAERRASDESLAARIEAEPIGAFVDRWERIPALSEQSQALIEQQRADRLSHDSAALAAALRGIGQAAYEPMWDDLVNVPVPTLIVSGSRDIVYSTHAARMKELLPKAHHEVIEGAGHSVHLEQPAAVVRAVEKFLDGVLI